MELSELTERLDERLDTAAYADLDASPNGLQVGTDSGEVEHVAFAVDAAIETIERAADAGADLLVTHHGLIWGNIERVTESNYRRIAPLVEYDLPLYVSHLPLDGHQELGNAAGLADLLNLGDRAPFGEIGPEFVGQCGSATDPYAVDELGNLLADELDTGDGAVQTLAFGPEQIEDVAIVTGSGVDWVGEAVARDVDALVTGEGKQKAFHEAREAGIHVILAGHYATETFGVEALQSLAEEWGLTTTFVDCPTGL